jgi:methane monooxygenase component A alpha chain
VAPDGEYYAMQCMAMLAESVDNNELRQGYLAQQLDEVRHVQAETYLARYYAKHYWDPAGFTVGRKAKALNPFVMPITAGFSMFAGNDPIVNSLHLQLLGETAYTNPLFVAFTEISAMSGDTVLPTMFLSIQSDEGRHMANGYSTLAAVLSDDRNLELLQADLDEAFWRQHQHLDLLLGTIFDYFRDTSLKTRPYREYWEQWIWNEWGENYVGKLAKFGLKQPSMMAQARHDVNWTGHTGAMFLHALWPLNYWRSSVLPTSDFDWYENNYPGWYDYFGPFWEDAEEKLDPKNGALALEAFVEIPPICRVCLLPTVFPRFDLGHVSMEEHNGKVHAFCSPMCRNLFYQAPERYSAHVNFGERYHGWDLADVLVDMQLLREDGKTLIGQPHVRDDLPMWTIDDIRRIGWEIKYGVPDKVDA